MTHFADLSNQMADAVEAAAAHLVTVHAARPISGTVVGPAQVLTVAHLLHADELTVRTPDGGELRAVVVGRDPSSDLALLRVEGLTLSPVAPTAGVRVGELLLAVGRPPHGVQATLGLLEQAEARRGWLPTGAAPFPGISGGVLVDARGGMVGLLNAGMRRGTLLAVPAERALKVVGLLASGGRVPQGYLGIATQPVLLPLGEAGTENEADVHRGRGPRGRGHWGGRRGHGRGRLGLTVVQVEQGSPAEAAGLRVGDILLSLGEGSVRHPGELLERVREHAGETLSARLLRGGEEVDVSFQIGER
ncbi:S1C family serine protease [Deinococcus hopiensis]|uniref:Serine protease, S1-C subfamily, contains C-terminal PDZ domain n=1 Tax=Deinococcus hopiensis KR-140 TaxID=695939 RepID=A0A1W1VF44_9DEIO|nr:trypsin-like peptidase domain-containing protein [Deinococcus hopiensis]SMB91594.1 serine protease, S1-C subfamily, contains C-terminal PDZ domain [Deinococcus hopiensis KR-140]